MTGESHRRVDNATGESRVDNATGAKQIAYATDTPNEFYFGNASDTR